MKYACLATREEMNRSGIKVVSFFFNARGSSLEKSTAGLYRSLLWQLLKPQGLDFVSQIWDNVMLDDFFSDTFPWTIESLESLFKAVIKKLKMPVICFIDALDECDENEVRQLVHLFQQLGQVASQHQNRFQVCFSSRHYPRISIRKAQELVLERLPGHKQDIIKYLEGALDVGTGPSADEVKSEVQRKSGGVFMWVVLVVRLLNKEYDRGQMSALRRRLYDIPEKWSDLFQEILTRHCNNSEQVLLCLQWLLFAKEPLSPRQLYCAILVRTGPDIALALEHSTEVVKNFLLSSSKGLAEIVGSPPTVQFIHESVRDFLLKEKGLQTLWSDFGQDLIGRSHERLKQCCVSYLAAFKAQYLTLGREIKYEASEGEDPFVRYAADNVLLHAEAAAANHIPQGEFLTNFDCLFWVVLSNFFVTKASRLHTTGTRLLYILAEVNASNLIECYPLKRSYLEIGEERCGTPLYVALAAGSVDAVQTFLALRVEGLAAKHPARKYLEEYSLDRTKKAETHWGVQFQRECNVLSHLFEYGEETVFAIFLYTTSPQDLLPFLSETDSQGRTVLLLAAIRGQYRVVELLLEQSGVEINIRDHSGMSALHYAAEVGHVGIVRLLTEKDGININLRNEHHETPTAIAIKNGRLEVVKTLLALKPDELELYEGGKSTSDFYPEALLPCALRWGNHAIIKSLLETRPGDIYLKYENGGTALTYAARYGREETVKLLLDTYQVDVNVKDQFGRTPLSYAAEYGREEIVKFLLESHQVEVDSRDNQGRTPFSWASAHFGLGSCDIWRYLLDIGHADPEAQDNDSRSSLWYAARNPNFNKVRFLLYDVKVDPNMRDAHGISPLQVAAWCGTMLVIEELLKIDNIDIREGDWVPPAGELFLPDTSYRLCNVSSRYTSDEGFQMIKDKWLAQQAIHLKGDQAETESSATRLTRSRKRALSTKSDSLGVRSLKR